MKYFVIEETGLCVHAEEFETLKDATRFAWLTHKKYEAHTRYSPVINYRIYILTRDEDGNVEKSKYVFSSPYDFIDILN